MAANDRQPGDVAAAERHAVDIDLLEILDDAGATIGHAVASVTLGRDPHDLRLGHRRYTATLTIDDRERSVKAAGVALMNAQHLRGSRIVPRGHPGDGTAEIQWYALTGADRSRMRSRLATGEHLAHPAIGRASFATCSFTAGRGWAVRADGTELGVRRAVTIRVIPQAFRLRF